MSIIGVDLDKTNLDCNNNFDVEKYTAYEK